MGRPSNTAERRAQILDGAQQVLAARGYEGASVAEIAQAAGITAGLVHYHFENKLEILLRLTEHLAAQLRARLEKRLVEADGHPRRQLERFVEVHLGLGADADPRALACWIAIGAEAVRERQVREVYRQALSADLAVLERLVRACLKAGGKAVRGAKTIAAAVFAAIEGYFLLAAAAPEVVPAGSASRTTCQLAFALISQAPGARPRGAA